MRVLFMCVWYVQFNILFLLLNEEKKEKNLNYSRLLRQGMIDGE